MEAIRELRIINEFVLSMIFLVDWERKGVFYPMKKLKVFLPFAVAALVLGLGACDKKDESKQGSSNQPVSSVPAKPSIKVTAADNKTKLGLNETVQLAADKEGVTWSSSDKNVADVSDTGLVTAKGYGSATITAKKEGHTDGRIVINVERPAPTATLHMEDADHYAADGMWYNNDRGPFETPVYTKSSASDGTCVGYFGEGDKETLTFTSDKAVKAELMLTMGHNNSFDPLGDIMEAKFNNAAIDLASRKYETDSDGQGGYQFQGVSFGMYDLVAGNNVLEITMKGNAPYLDDLEIYAASAATIAVVPAAEKEAIAITNDEAELTIEAEATVQLKCATAGVTYATSNEAVATVSETGLVTGVAKGNATIFVTKTGMKSTRVTIKVTDKVVAGEIKAEIETGKIGDVDIAEADTAIIRRTTSGGETCTAQWGAGAVLTIKFNVTSAGSYKMYLNGRAAGQYGLTDVADLAAVVEVKVNNTAVAIPAETAISGRTFTDYLLGVVTLKAGENTIEVKALGEEADQVPNIDFFKFVPNA